MDAGARRRVSMTSTRRSFAGITACLAICPTSALGPVLWVNALVSSVSGSLRQGPGSDCHLLSVGHAVRTSLILRRFAPQMTLDPSWVH
jgi:hypothetical protein